MRFCASNRLCRQFPRGQWRKLCAALHYKSFKPGDVLFQQGDAVTGDACVYVVLDGVVQICVNGDISMSTASVNSSIAPSTGQYGDVVTTLHRGGVFGESGALGSGGERTGTAVALAYTQLVALRRYMPSNLLLSFFSPLLPYPFPFHLPPSLPIRMFIMFVFVLYLCSSDAMGLLDDPSLLFVPTTDHSQRILKKPVDSRTKQEVEYLRSFLLGFKPFQSLSKAGLDAAVATVAFATLKPNTQGAAYLHDHICLFSC
jgi:hypothetical protein